ncbi:MAG: hypothetical protein CM15mP78_00120 [Candidatus Poseidoniales archaeon]|nr:MAG: hypothetical protein CM15mP78_00120 [Candidatus Poseidoniales archaeon]
MGALRKFPGKRVGRERRTAFSWGGPLWGSIKPFPSGAATGLDGKIKGVWAPGNPANVLGGSLGCLQGPFRPGFRACSPCRVFPARKRGRRSNQIIFGPWPQRPLASVGKSVLMACLKFNEPGGFLETPRGPPPWRGLKTLPRNPPQRGDTMGFCWAVQGPGPGPVFHQNGGNHPSLFPKQWGERVNLPFPRVGGKRRRELKGFGNPYLTRFHPRPGNLPGDLGLEKRLTASSLETP